MKQHQILAMMALSCLASVSFTSGLAQHHQSAATTRADDIVKSAMSAAPPAIAQNATIIAISSDGKMQTVRRGANNFTCMPDNPTTPGPDPMCMDQNALEWATAWLERKEPPTGKVGFIYMLSGGTDASNTDPYAQKPESGNNWIETGPHVMVVGARGMMEGYPRDATPDSSQPYVMWPDTPYEHLMLPVQPPPTGVAAQ